jgi:hypothetical protein
LNGRGGRHVGLRWRRSRLGRGWSGRGLNPRLGLDYRRRCDRTGDRPGGGCGDLRKERGAFRRWRLRRLSWVGEWLRLRQRSLGGLYGFRQLGFNDRGRLSAAFLPELVAKPAARARQNDDQNANDQGQRGAGRGCGNATVWRRWLVG